MGGFGIWGAVQSLNIVMKASQSYVFPMTWVGWFCNAIDKPSLFAWWLEVEEVMEKVADSGEIAAGDAWVGDFITWYSSQCLQGLQIDTAQP